MTDLRIERLNALLEAAKQLGNAHLPLGREARERLPEATGLSPEGVELALAEHLEHRIGRVQIRELIRRVPAAPHAHVLLSANVFVGAFRAIALGLAQSEQVWVRPSRRETLMAELLHRGSGECFQLASELSPAPQDHLWVYGSDDTLAQVRGKLPLGVTLHAYGSGMGVALVSPAGPVRESQLAQLCEAIARDVVVFDQRGCLSPRMILVNASRSFAETFADCLAETLEAAARRVPLGKLNREELAERRRYTETFGFVGGLRAGKSAAVVLDPVSERLYLPPTGRVLHITVTQSPLDLLQTLAPKLTSVGLSTSENLAASVRQLLPGRRVVALGEMQRPSFDGPVDGRQNNNLAR